MQSASHSIARLLTAVFAVMTMLACATHPTLADDADGQPEVRVKWKDDDTCIYTCGDWELQIHYLQKGTRSEGQDGELRHKGKAVKPDKDKPVLDTPLGQVKHYGDERKVLWATTGWNFADKKKVKRAAEVEAEHAQDDAPADNEAGDSEAPRRRFPFFK